MDYPRSAEDTAPIQRTAFLKEKCWKENVKGIFSSGGGRDFAIVLYELAALGYSIEYALVNSKDFGVPQSRVPKAENVSTLSEILQEEVPEKYFLSEEQTRKLLDKLLEAHKEVECMTQRDYPQLSLQEVQD